MDKTNIFDASKKYDLGLKLKGNTNELKLLKRSIQLVTDDLKHQLKIINGDIKSYRIICGKLTAYTNVISMIDDLIGGKENEM